MMSCVYEGQGPTDAYRVRDWFARNAVWARVKDAAWRSWNWPSVWVFAADRQRAEAMLWVVPARRLPPSWYEVRDELNESAWI